jgi:methyltransferase (TIGR00027 family)
MVQAGVARDKVHAWIQAVESRGADLTTNDLELLFTPDVRAKWPILADADRFRASAATMRFATATVESVDMVDDHSVVVQLRRAGLALECRIAVEEAPPHRIESVRDTLEGGVSLSAVNVAISRALHRRYSTVKMFDDWLAERVGGPFVVEAVERTMAMGARTTPPVMPLARFRLAETELAAAIAEGCRQYVILGAGLDSWAYRNTDLAREAGVAVYEVDEPATQRFKRARLADAGIPDPGFVRFVPVNFERDTLSEQLDRAGFDAALPAVVAWLGVTYYLTQPAIEATLGFVAGLASDSRLIVDYFRPPDTWDAAITNGSILAANNGEPWLTTFSDDDLDLLLTGCGMHVVDRLTASQALARYPTDDKSLVANEATVAVVGHVI